MDLLIPKADIILPADVSMVDEIAETLLARVDHGGDFSGFKVVFPGRRPALYLRKRLGERLQRPFLPPEIFDVDSFMRYLAEMLPSAGRRVELEQEQLIYLLYQTAKSVLERRADLLSMFSGFDRFYFWGGQLLNVMDELGVGLVPASRIGQAVQAALMDAGLTEHARGLWSALPDLYRAWQEALSEKGVWSRGEIYRYAAEAAEQGCRPDGFLYLCGFVAPNNAELCVISALRAGHGTVVVSQESGSRPDGLSSHKAVYFHQAHDLHSEVRRARDILLSLHEPGRPGTPEDVALVLPRPEPLVPVLDWILEDLSVPFNISMGYPLSRTPVYYLMDHVFQAQEGREEGYYQRHYLAVLTHPYVKGLGAVRYDVDDMNTPFRGLVRYLCQSIKERRNMFVTLKEVEDIAREFVESASPAMATLRLVHRVAFRSFEQVDTVGDLARGLMDFLSLLVREGPAGRHPLSNEFAGTALDLFERLFTGPMASEAASPSGLFAMFRHLVRQVRIPFQGSPLDGLQVLGFLETRCLRFRKVVILDAAEGILPPKSAPEPLLPPGLRKRLGLPDSRLSVDISREHLFRLLSGAQEAHILFVEGQEVSRSRFVDEIIWRRERHAGRVEAVGIDKVESSLRPRIARPEEVPKSVQVVNHLRTLRFSPTSLDTYVHCPYRFYLRYVLGLDPARRNSVEQIDALLVGDAVHETLRRLYAPYLNKDMDYNDLEEKMPGILDHVLREKALQNSELKGGFRLLYEVIRVRLGHMLRIEGEQPRRRPIALELSCRFSFGPVSGHRVTLQGTLDRVDRDSDGSVIVIDYKTGSHLRLPGHAPGMSPVIDRRQLKEQIRSLQLPVYLFLIRNHLGWDRYPWESFSACLYSLKGLSGKSGYRDLARPLFNSPEVAGELMDGFYSPVIKGLLEEILNPDLSFEQDVSDSAYCANCPYAGGMCAAGQG